MVMEHRTNLRNVLLGIIVYMPQAVTLIQYINQKKKYETLVLMQCTITE